MVIDVQARFGAGAEAWADYNQKPLGRIRHEVTWRNLVRYLPDVADTGNPPRVLDAGGGSGELALQLVQRGYCVWLLDYTPAMLNRARQAARGLAADVRARLTFCLMSASDAPRSFASDSFDAVTCHTLIEYLPEPRDTLRGLVSLLRNDGLLSLSFVNRHAEVLRQAWSRGDPAGALTKLEGGSFCASLFDIPGMAYSAEEVGAWLIDLGLKIKANRGVRAFADFVPRERLDDPEFFDALLRLEFAAANCPPYSSIARYAHLIAQKDIELS